MPDYAHRHKLHNDDANLHPRNSEHARVIRASFALAELAHCGESRKKIDSAIEYISHPIMVYDILNELGEEKDSALLAAAFLHDVLELNHYRDNPERLQRELEVEFEREGISHAHAKALADDIYALVYEVTNPEVLPKNKELYQIDRVESMSLRAKKLKIADQCASFICNLLQANDTQKISYEGEIGFTEKAVALCETILESVQKDEAQREAMRPYEKFFHRVQREVSKLFMRPHATEREIHARRMHVRRHFDYQQLFSHVPLRMAARRKGEDLERRRASAADAGIAEKLSLYAPEALPDELESGRALGLLRVDYDKMGRVVKFFMHVSNDPSKDDEANQMQQAFTAEIREKLRLASAYTETGKETVELKTLRPGERAKNDNVRVYHLHPPMPHDAFAAAAKNAKVCSLSDAKVIARTGAQLKAEHLKASPVPPRPAPEKNQEESRMARLARRTRGDFTRER